MIRFLISQFEDPRLLGKYVVSGCIAAAIQLGSLVLLVEKVGLTHTAGVPIAFILSAIVAFCLQKFWTFGHRDIEGIHFQIFSYIMLLLTALLLNIIFMYVFVDLFGIWYLLAQVLTIGLATIVTFLGNKYLVFKREPGTQTSDKI